MANFIQLSPRFSYTLAKKLDGIPEEGSTRLWVMRACKIYGNCRDDVYPTDYSLPVNEFKDYSRIPIEAFLDAMAHKIPYYQRLYTTDDCIKAINENAPISFSFDIFEAIRNAPKGLISLPRIGEKHLGSHSVMIIGYTKIEGEKFFIVHNSWGTKWGDKGRGYLPFTYFEHGLVSEAFADGIMGMKPVTSKRYFLSAKRKLRFEIVHNQYPPLRNSKYYLYTINIYLNNLSVGHVHMSPLSKTEMEIEEFYILPQYQNEGIGTVVLKHIQDNVLESGYVKLVAWIPAQDIIPSRKKSVMTFFEKNKFSTIEDNSRFRDSVYKIEKQLKK